MSAAPFWLTLGLSLAQAPAPAMSQEQVDAARKLEKESSELQRAGRYADAEKPLQAAIDLWMKYRGPDDVEILQDMIVAAVNEAMVLSQELAAKRLSALTGGLKLPGLF